MLSISCKHEVANTRFVDNVLDFVQEYNLQFRFYIQISYVSWSHLIQKY